MIPAKAAAVNAPDFSAHKLIHKNLGEPYFLEAGQPGFFELYSRKSAAGEMILEITAPQEFYAELYLLPHGQSQARLIPGNAGGTFRIPGNIDWRAWGNALLFEARDGAPRQFDVGFKLSSAAGEVLYEQRVPIEILPATASAPKEHTLKLGSWYGYPLQRIYPEATGRGVLPEKLLRYWESAGFSGAPGMQAPGWDCFINLTNYFPYHSPGADGIRKMVTVGGSEGILSCPSALIAAGGGFYASELRRHGMDKIIREKKLPVTVDYEPYCYGWVTEGCFCEECRTAFQKFAKLDKRPGVRTILLKHQPQWIEFRCHQRAGVVKAMADGVRQVAPGTEFWLCSMPMPGAGEDAEYFKLYGIDPRLHEPHVDQFLPMNYDPGILFYRRLERDRLALRKPVHPLGDNGWSTFDGYYPKRVELQLVSAAFLGFKDYYFGKGLPRLDAGYLQAIKRALHTAVLLNRDENSGAPAATAAFEAAVPEQDRNNFHVFKCVNPDGTTLLMLVNNGLERKLYARVSANPAADIAGTYQITDPEAGVVLSPDGRRKLWQSAELGSGFDIEVPALGWRIVRFGRDEKSAWPLRDVRVAAAANAARNRNLRERAGDKSANGMSFKLTSAGAVLATPIQSLTVNLNDGGAAVWNVNQRPVATLGADGMTDPAVISFRGTTVNIENSQIDSDTVSAEFRFPVRGAVYTGLEVCKTYTLRRNDPQMEVKIAVVPTGGYRPFRFRAITLLHVAAAVPGKPYGALIGYRVPGPGGNTVTDLNAKHTGFLRGGALQTADFRHYAPSPGELDGNWCEGFDRATGAGVRVEFAGVNELFMWRGGSEATIEMVYADAYPDRDPHKVRTWTAEYKLKYVEDAK